MASYVDRRPHPKRHHLAADTLDELHLLAERAHIHRRWFHSHPEHPHYDVNSLQRQWAIECGAIRARPREVLAAAKRSVTK